MIKRKCIICGREMRFNNPLEKRDICSETCSRENMRRQLASTDEGPSMPPLKAENITDEGYIALVKAVVSRASHDVTHFKPGTQVRVQAEKFFESEYFSALTGLDGQAILRDLREEYNKNKHRPNEDKAFVRRRVRCVETDKEYKSIKAAAEACKISTKTLWDHLNGGSKTAAGLHWEYVEG